MRPLADVMTIVLAIGVVLTIASGVAGSVPAAVGETNLAAVAFTTGAAAGVADVDGLQAHVSELEARLAELHRQADVGKISDNDARIDIVRTQKSKAERSARQDGVLPCSQLANGIGPANEAC